VELDDERARLARSQESRRIHANIIAPRQRGAFSADLNPPSDSEVSSFDKQANGVFVSAGTLRWLVTAELLCWQGEVLKVGEYRESLIELSDREVPRQNGPRVPCLERGPENEPLGFSSR